MAHVDDNYYKNEFKGKMLSEAELEQKLMLASLDIDSLTYNRINSVGFDNLTEFQKERIKLSICLHAEFMAEYGEMLDSPISGYSAGTTSVQFKQDNIISQNGVKTSNSAFNLLKQTGLTVRLFI